MAQDVFPQTLKTWIGDKLSNSGKAGKLEVNRHLMSTYAQPLTIYFLGTNSRWLGEPEDVINGFFASRLDQDEFFDKWQASGMRLRRWLMNAFSFYLMELRRQRKNDQSSHDLSDDPMTFSGDPDRAIDQASVVAFVRKAMDEAAQACREEDMSDHWQVFLRHHTEGADFRAIAKEFGVDSARAAVMSRTAARKFRSALHDVLLRDGVAEDQIDEEIQSLLHGAG